MRQHNRKSNFERFMAGKRRLERRDQWQHIEPLAVVRQGTAKYHQSTHTSMDKHQS